ncbi:hypothetical protein [Nonomuraea jiangxiensis]|uniref:Uncharacterized protein n=1 Tax=Nonomuraea jiangxiensis TaxID=633440 RepID=A0A1G8HN54_9ACTN|nr:hypothetical protein [Nonomuraea jiangxiensis]SDI08093.1 hypothetical protein SAMN05421869_104230 [Nonomuraea jiangxiensis]
MAATESACAREAPTGRVNTRVLRQIAYDYEPAKTPEALAREKHVNVVVVGKVTGWLPGPIASSGRTPQHWVLMRVQVERRLKGISDDVVYLPVWQGGVLGGTKTPHQGVDDFRRAAPKGMRVLMFLGKERPGGPTVISGPITKNRTKLPSATPRYWAPPQGVILHEVGTDGIGRAVGGLVELPRSGSYKAWDQPCGIDGLITRLQAEGLKGR